MKTAKKSKNGKLSETIKKRKNEVEYQQQTDDFKPPSKEVYKINELLYDFVILYGKNNWALSTYRVNKGLIDNYINPKIGELDITKITARTIEEFYSDLKVIRLRWHATGIKTRA